MANHALTIAQSLIRFPSVTPKDEGAQDYLKTLLKEAGFTIYDLPFEGNGSYPVQNFFARKGTNAPHLCFAGHTDVVPPGDEALWSVPPFAGEVKDGKLIGRGSSDMKGQIAAFVAAALAYAENNPDHKGSISLLITGDEEADAVNGTVRVLEWMAENNHIPDACLVGEPSNPDFMGQEIKIGRRGSLSGVLTVMGTQGHVAYPQRASNPMRPLIRMIDALQSHVFDKGSAHFQPTNLEVTSIDVGNMAINVIPGKATARFNIRYSDRFTRDELAERVRNILDQIDTNYDLQLNRGASSFLTAPGEWTGLVSRAVETVTGHKPILGTNGGTSDARFVAQYCPVVECGMINRTIHQIDEHCTLEHLDQCDAIYREILKLYFA